eukprot:4836474-Pyramimonas_sp.AAC.1
MEAPALWVAISLCMLSLVVARRRERGFGVRLLVEASELLVDHWLWADNVILAASTRGDMLSLLTDLTESIHAHGFAWKQSSLECLACGCAGPQRPLQITVPTQSLGSAPQHLTYEIPQ